MRLRLPATYATMTLLLSACGGGGGSGGGGTVVIPPTPTPVPTPTPAPPPTGRSLLNLTASEQFTGVQGYHGYRRAPSGLVTVLNTYSLSATPNFAYQVSNTWTFLFSGSSLPSYDRPETALQAQFRPADRVAGSSDGAFTVYQRTYSGNVYSLALLKPGSGNPLIGLNYMGIAIAQGEAAEAVGTQVDYRPMGFGILTPDDTEPRVGTGRYTGVVVGRALAHNSISVYDISGSIALDLDYAARTFVGTITLTATNDRSGASISLGTFPVSQSGFPRPLITMLGTINNDGRNDFRAYLGGPAAEELAGAFSLELPDPQAAGVTLTIMAAHAARR